MTDERAIDKAKRERLLDMLRRATANGSHQEVAAAIVLDWFPLLQIEPNGNIKILIGGRDTGPRDT